MSSADYSVAHSFALCPLDGRYAQKVEILRNYFSEHALMKYRITVEIEWLIHLSEYEKIKELRAFSTEEKKILQSIAQNFNEQNTQEIKNIESTTKHDVKAVEYFLKNAIKNTSLEDISEWIHFACTSEDINNLAYSLMLRDAIAQVMLPAYDVLLENLEQKAKAWKSIALLSLTHGQSASPITVGKMITIFAARISAQMNHLSNQEFLGKINGATGSFNAHAIAYPDIDWLEVSQTFIEKKLKLTWNPFSDQIDPHDFIAELSHTMVRLNTILIDLCRDFWGYISRGIFTQKTKAGEIGSSTMPHKVNPIDFENAEGNFGIANALFEFYAQKLPISRFQRDLTDSTVLRSVGVAFGHSFLSIQSLMTGLGKIEINEEKCAKELEENVEVLAEAVQTVMRKCGIENPYEQLKELTRGKRLTLEAYRLFVQNLSLPLEEKQKLLTLTPHTYTGISEKIVELMG